MKKGRFIIKIIVMLFLANESEAQVSFFSDTVQFVYFPNNNSLQRLYDTIYNNSNVNKVVSWQKTAEQLSNGWSLIAMCDNNACYPNNTTLHQMVIPANSKGFIYTDMKASEMATGCAVVQIDVIVDNSSRTLTYIHTVEPTIDNCKISIPNNLQSISQSDEGNLVYPSQVYNCFAIKSTNARYVQVVDLTGKVILVQQLQLGQNEIHLSNSLPSQVLFVKLFNAENQRIQTEKIIKK